MSTTPQLRLPLAHTGQFSTFRQLMRLKSSELGVTTVHRSRRLAPRATGRSLQWRSGRFQPLRIPPYSASAGTSNGSTFDFNRLEQPHRGAIVHLERLSSAL